METDPQSASIFTQLLILLVLTLIRGYFAGAEMAVASVNKNKIHRLKEQGNTKAALITRGIAEISRLGVAMGGKPETFTGLSGIGDLIVTCASMHSRNRRAGILMGQGKTMEEAMAEVKMVVEGVYSAKAARELSRKYKIDMPIIEEVNEILFENKPAKDAVKDLMFRDKKPELAWE